MFHGAPITTGSTNLSTEIFWESLELLKMMIAKDATLLRLMIYTCESCNKVQRFISEVTVSAQKLKFSIKDFFCKSDQNCESGHIYWRKSFMENFFVRWI